MNIKNKKIFTSMMNFKSFKFHKSNLLSILLLTNSIILRLKTNMFRAREKKNNEIIFEKLKIYEHIQSNISISMNMF